MKRIFLLTFCLATTIMAWASPITKEQARSQARQFVEQRRLPSAGNIVLSDVSHRSMHQSQSANPTSPTFYVFNVGSDDGFVIVSADDSTLPILGYCDHGSFDEADMRENMRELLEIYEEEMLRVQSIDPEPSSLNPQPSTIHHQPSTILHQPSTINHQPSAVKEAIAPLLTTKWNQSAPFNLQCPFFLNNSNNSRCVTGCVATSMALVLAYVGNRPAGTTMDIPGYSCTTKWTSDSIQIYVERKTKTTFDWKNMLDVYDDNATDTQKQAVAKLMAYCGAAIHADYGEKSTSAYQSQVAPALRTFFNMDATRIMRSNYTYVQWLNIIYAELEAGRPVIYDGHSSGGGHSFAIGGFDGGDLFHGNWGWVGKNDGYFALSVLNPHDNSGIGASTSHDGYSYNQSATIGIQPGATPVIEPAQLTPRNLAVSGNKVTFGMYNHTGETLTFDAGIGIIDDEGYISNVIKIRENWKLDDNYGNSKLSATFNSLNLEPGVYHYVPTSKESSSNTWHTMMSYWKDYVEVTVASDYSVSLRLMPFAPELSLVGGLTYPSGNKYVDQNISITAKVKNSGGEFCGPLYLFASQTNDKGKYNSRLGMTIAAGATAEAAFSFKPSKEGTWNIWLCTDSEGKNVLGSNTMVVSKSTYVNPGYLEVTKLNILSPIDEDSWTTDGQGIRQVDVLSKLLQLIPTVRNTSNTNLPGANKVQVKLQKNEGSTWKDIRTINYTINDFNVNKGYNLTMSGGNPIDFGEIGYGLYRIAIYLNGEVQDVHFQLNLTGGYPVWAADGTRTLVKTTAQSLSVSGSVVAIDLSGYEFSSLTPNDNPNTLYVFDATQTVPASLQGRNVVQDGEADRITLTDGYSFFSPLDFTAQTISYSRIFTTPFTTEGTGWNTMTLPFKPTAITAEGRQIDWFRSDYDENKDFFIMEFSGDDETTAYFDYTEHFQPYIPYIIGLPGEEFGSASLINKEIVFSADNAAVPATHNGVRSGSSYKFHGSTTKTAGGETIFLVNTPGNAFVPSTNSMKPFRSYFTALGNIPKHISIDYRRFKPSGIVTVQTDDSRQPQDIYTLGGLRVDTPHTSQPSPLKKGLYISNGRKIVIK